MVFITTEIQLLVHMQTCNIIFLVVITPVAAFVQVEDQCIEALYKNKILIKHLLPGHHCCNNTIIHKMLPCPEKCCSRGLKE
jgi:hypothetical protein